MGRRKLYWALLAGYLALMGVLLFHRELPEDMLPYWQQLEHQVNLAPGKTIGLYLGLLGHSRAVLRRLAVINLAGNVIMFLPLGFLLPRAVPKLGKLWKTGLASLAAIAAVELCQLLTLRGTCDVDDLILNMAGVLLGYGIHRLTMKKAASA